jgi:hypothetical protein
MEQQASTPNPAEAPRGPCFIGIDVAKDWLDVAVRPSGQAWRVENTEAAMAVLVAQMPALQPQSWS